MSNISIDLNLRQLKSRIVKTSTNVECILIPIDENGLIRGEKGIYLNLTAFELKNKAEDQKNTHLVKQSLKKEIYEQMSDEEKRALPVIGNAIYWGQHKRSEPEPQDTSANYQPSPDDDLPF